MKVGTPGFFSERLRAGREARGLSAASLAEMIGISKAAVSQYENGHGSPAPDVMRRIGQVLNLPLQHFLLAPPAEDDGLPFFRCMAAATKTARVRAFRRYRWFREIVHSLQYYVKLIHPNVPELSLPSDPKAISDSMIEDYATLTRRTWNLGDGPISNVVWLLENNGFIVARHDLCADSLDAFSLWTDNRSTPYVILGTAKHSAARSRFDAAHELAHLLLHNTVESRSFNYNSDFRFLEQQAHRFAGAFLLPAASFSEDLRGAVSLDLLRCLKSKWKVAIGAMISRAAQLNLISESHERRLWINMGRRHWRTREPLDDTLEIEQPRFIRRSIELVIDKGIVSAADLPFQIGLSERDIEELCGLRESYFSEAMGRIRIDLKDRCTSEIPNPEPRIIQFQRQA
jgi:Zn-dependent peptidase ImmA (M78 family)/transcriptional regulator with XRE-family HTH domain